MKHVLTGVLALLVVGMAGTARADLDKEDVAKIVKLKTENKAFDRYMGSYPDRQAVSFHWHSGPGMGEGLLYVIDLQTQLCFVAVKSFSGLSLVPCKSVKKGYPLIAPLITWDD